MNATKNLLFVLCAAAALSAAASFRSTVWKGEEALREDPAKYWNLAELTQKPDYRPCPYSDSIADGLEAYYVTGYSLYPNAPRENEFFVYYGVPEGPMPEGGWPAILLVHGGGGTAYPNHVREWVRKGYVVLAPDWYQTRPVPKNPEKEWEIIKKTPIYATIGNNGNRNHVNVVKNLVLAHSLLRSMPQVNPEKTVYIGLSWGSIYGALVGVVDTRFKGIIEIYCGMKSAGLPVNSPLAKKILGGQFLHAAKVPYYWICGTNDIHANPDEMAASFAEVPHLENKTVVVRLPHAHCGFQFDACARMADHFLKGAPNLPVLGDPKREGRTIRAKIVDPGKGITHPILAYTKDKSNCEYQLYDWKTTPAEIKDGEIVAEIPDGAAQVFLSGYEGEPKRKFYLCGSTPVVTIESQRCHIGTRGVYEGNVTESDMTFVVGVTDANGVPMTAGRCEAVVDNFGTNVQSRQVFDLAEANPFEVKATGKTPGMIRLSVKGLEKDDPWNGTWAVAYRPRKITPAAPCPKDFEQFWRDALAKYDREVPDDVTAVLDEKGSTKAYDLYRVSFSAPLGRKMYGLLTVPKNRDRKYRTRFYIPGAGASTSYLGGDSGCVRMTVNVHYYEPVIGSAEHEEPALKRQREENAEWRAKYPAADKNAGYSVLGIAASREDYYYYGTILGMQRAIRWLYRQPYVDQTKFSYDGSSQGGGMGLAAVALFGKFTSARIGVAAMCDHLGFEVEGRQPGWPNLIEKQLPENRAAARANAPYFDGCNFATLITTPVLMNIHYCDGCCAPTGQWAAYNAIPAKVKKVIPVLGRGHDLPPPRIREKIEFWRWQPFPSR